MIVSHESRHSSLFHLADLILLQIAKVIFWFHPLVYVYNKRLLLVHEYQADSVAAPQPQAYGRFLVEQALLQSAPSVAHSFNRSPIKNRIVMLTRRSTALAKGKMLVFLPVALVCTLCFSSYLPFNKSERGGQLITFKGNKIELSTKEYRGTIIMGNNSSPRTDSLFYDPVPVKLNGDKIYSCAKDAEQPIFAGKEHDLWNYLFSKLQRNFEELPDGYYPLHLYNVVIDENGKLAFYQFEGVSNIDNLAASKRKSISEKIKELLDKSPEIKPAKVNGNNVAYWWSELGNEFIIVNNHVATLNNHGFICKCNTPGLDSLILPKRK
jgi:hypothetical protein